MSKAKIKAKIKRRKEKLKKKRERREKIREKKKKAFIIKERLKAKFKSKKEAEKIGIGKERREKFKRLYAAFFVIGVALFIASVLNKNWFLATISFFIKFLSLIFYGKKERLSLHSAFNVYLLIWFVGLVLGIISVYKKRSIPAIISFAIMLFCSFIAGMARKHSNYAPIIGDIRKAQKKSKRYKTNFDNLLFILKKYKKAKISQLSRGFGVEKEKIEDWAQILENHGLLEIHYPPFGGAELRIKKEGKKESE